MEKSIENDIDTAAYSESMKKLMVNQMINTVAKNINKHIADLCDAIDKIMEDGKVRKDSLSTKWMPSFEMLSGIQLILDERERQVNELEYDDENDDCYTSGELSVLAEKYILGGMAKKTYYQIKNNRTLKGWCSNCSRN